MIHNYQFVETLDTMVRLLRYLADQMAQASAEERVVIAERVRTFAKLEQNARTLDAS
jgi:hypothetical protein